MKKLLCKLLRQNAETREGTIVSVSALNIAVNLVLAALKIMIGTISSSIAIVSEGVNNATDSVSSLLTIIGTKLAEKHPTEKHPFGYGRAEYLTGLVVSALILVTGIELMIISIKLVLSPEPMSVSVLTLVIIAISAIVKLFLGLYTIREGRHTESASLEAVGLECRNDCIISVVTILSSVLFLVFHFSLDAYVGILMALIVLKAGLTILRDTLSDLLGQSGKKELADELYRIILAEPVVINAADMVLHNYGPERYQGSVNIEVDHQRNIGEIYAAVHALQLKIMHEYRITMVFGIYAVDAHTPEIQKLRQYLNEFVSCQEHVESFHALYVEPGTNKIYCDLVVDYRITDWDALRKDFCAYVEKRYPGREVELVIETRYIS